MKQLKKDMWKISTFEEARDFVKRHPNEVDNIEVIIKSQKERVVIDVCVIAVSLYSIFLPALQLLFYETSQIEYAFLGIIWAIPLIIAIIDIIISRKKQMAWDYIFLAIYDFKYNK